MSEIVSLHLANVVNLLDDCLLIQAFDTTVVEKSLRDRINPINFSVAIPVIHFLVMLFTENYKKIFSQAIFDNFPDPIPQDAFQSAVVYFTHWKKAAESSIINDNSSWKPMSRGMAIQCHNHQKAIDFVLSVLFDRRKTLSRWVMSAIFLQIKNRYFTSGNEEHNSRPYITIVMELGLK
ncbi:hypothetical protein BU17DRAFT_44728 [Hysterangium stoloniferum]|nr:hypothetical protein BU17DRAFT_44728 [Hysterangium stoloniferum]